MKKFQTLAAALAIGLGAAAAGQVAFAQERDMTVVRDTPNGVVTKHIRREVDGPVVHRTVRVDRPDGTTVIRHVNRWRGDEYRHHEASYRDHDRDYYRHAREHGYDRDHGRVTHRTVVIHHREVPMRHVVVREVHRHPAYVVNRHVTVIHNAG
jgi:hypothetical protein